MIRTDSWRTSRIRRSPTGSRREAEYTKAVLAKIPAARHDSRGSHPVRRRGAGTRQLPCRSPANMFYYLKRRADENIAKLYVRGAAGGKERLLVDPEKLPAPEGKHNAIDYFAASPDNKYLAYGVSVGGSEESVLHVIEVASSKETGDVDRSRQLRLPVLARRRPVALQPTAETGAERTSDRQVRQFPGLPPCARQQPGGRYAPSSAPDSRRRLPSSAPEIPIAVSPVGSRYVIGLVINGVQNELRIYVRIRCLARRRQDAVGQTRRHGRRRDGLRRHGRGSLPPYPQERFAFQGHQRLACQAGSRRCSRGRAGERRRDHRHRRCQGRAVRAADERRRKRFPEGRLRGRREAVDDPPAVSWRRRRARRPIRGGRAPSSTSAAGHATAVTSPTIRRPTRSATPVCSRKGKYDNPLDLTSIEVKVKAKDGTLVPLSIVHRKGLKLDGSNPTILYGYGAYGISQTPFYRPDVSAVVQPRRRAGRGPRARRRRIRRGLAQGRLQAHQAQHLERRHRVRRMAGRAQVHFARKDGDHGRQRRWNLRRPLDHGAPRPLRSSRRRGPGVGPAAAGSSRPTVSRTSPSSAR